MVATLRWASVGPAPEAMAARVRYQAVLFDSGRVFLEADGDAMLFVVEYSFVQCKMLVGGCRAWVLKSVSALERPIRR